MSVDEEGPCAFLDEDEEQEADIEREAHPEQEPHVEPEKQEPAEAGAVEGADDEVRIIGNYGPDKVNDEVFEELVLGDAVTADVQNAWSAFLRGAESREAASEALYAAFVDAAPSFQGLFKTPRGVMTVRIMTGINQLVTTLGDPKALKALVELIGFQHLALEVTALRVAVFRDAIVDLLTNEVGDAMTPAARTGWLTLLNYCGGAYIFIRVKYAERLRCIAKSWAKATGKSWAEAGEEGDEDEEEEEEDESGEGTASTEQQLQVAQKAKVGGRWFRGTAKSGSGSAKSGSGSARGGSGSQEAGQDFQNTAVPKTFHAMFTFNANVMGFGSRAWMQEVLACFDPLVSNAANSYRMQEECDVLALRMAKFKGNINLAEFKSVMLASLRSLVKDWASLHEVSWCWLWDIIERMLKKLMGRPVKQEAALAAFIGSLDEGSWMTIRLEVYPKFFALAPAGEDIFKQSLTRLHFIADKLMATTLEMYREPKRMVGDLSALGLRHVGYSISPNLFGPFVTAWVQVVRMLTGDGDAEESFTWSLSLISRILMRVITEGATIVMKAINANSKKGLKKALSCAPRGKRAIWMLNVQVGTKSISPLMWAIETGSIDAAKAIIVDLLTIRADRDKYYYGMDILFEEHPDIIKRLGMDAPGLLPVLMDGLIWRSRITESGRRRVNYYIKHLVVDAEGGFAPAIGWITDFGDPKLVCHPVVSTVTDIVWEGAAFRSFLTGKLWFFFTLIVFVLSQSILPNLQVQQEDGPAAERIAIFVCRVFIYTCSMGQQLFRHGRRAALDIRKKEFIRVGCFRAPACWSIWQEMVGVLLTLLLALMLCMEPIIYCLTDPDVALFARNCEEGDRLQFAYSVMSSAAMLMYFLLLSDLSVLSTQVSAYALVCVKVLPEVALFLFGLTFFVLAFACAVSSLEQDGVGFQSIPETGLQLFKMTFGMFPGAHYDMLDEYPVLLAAIFFFVITVMVFLSNLLIAQLSCAYQALYEDMVGYARLNRGKIVSETMASLPKARWQRFLSSLHLEERVEFGEGDIGLAGGVQIWEPSAANITTVDMIRRFGGTTSATAEWPEDDFGGDGDDGDRFDRMERLVEKAMKRMASGKKKVGLSSSVGSTSNLGASQESSDTDSKSGTGTL